ncbi:MAG: periplasmic sensor signal transduction histidine kinase [Deltaproteobacteria bacterium]|nr:periplasmic sensor signal transduction histidine kinase [Deltaproteobacteria bacterium]
MLPMVRSSVAVHRRAWIYVLSVAALLVPAAGIAYLGAVSYRDERGAVSAQTDGQRQAALGIAARIDHAIEQALDEAERAVAQAPPPASLSTPLGRYWFWIDNQQQLRVPRAAPATVELGGALDRGVGCAGGRLEDCERELRTRTKRALELHAALRAEASQSWAEAKRLYLAAAFEDTEPAALLGLARVHAALGDPARASQALADLERKYGDRTFKGVSVRLVVAALRAEAAGPDAVLDVAEAVLDARYGLDPIVRLGVLARLRHELERPPQGGRPQDPPLSAAQLRRRTALDERVTAIRSEARAAAGLADEVAEVVRTATPAWRGRPAAREPARTLVYRRCADGSGIVGVAVDAQMLERIALEDHGTSVAQNARPLVLAAGAVPGPDLRTIVQVPLGTALPHLSLAVVNPVADPDPLDEVIRERSRRHVAYTSALAIALGLGLLATIRGAARARELAQLKSDFVSTVSHELKTPLTSIRMFAEMLEQGVAQGDAAKMARYHGVIVQESQRLGLLIANLLDYAQIERGNRRYTRSRQQIGQLARQAVTTFETLRDPDRGGSNSIEVEVSPEAMRAEVETDRDVVVQAVLNLVNNAAKYGGADGAIAVTVGADAQAVSIGVRDHGPGIPASEQARIFREFYRSPEAYRSGVEGTGLGLALVKQHIEALGGSVEVASTLGEGSTFTIRLPRAGEATP